jgi:Predicted phosphatase homologous to the C-terminal domain of histone macroH2A1
MAVEIFTVEGDLLDQDVEVIVNAWNRNFIPYWLLWPQGVSGAIRRRAGKEPFRELRRHGLLPLGGAVLTSAGRLPHKGIIHVAGLSLWWTAGEKSVRLSTRNALNLARGRFHSIAFPLIGAGTGGLPPERVEAIMTEEMKQAGFPGEVRLVRYVPAG